LSDEKKQPDLPGAAGPRTRGPMAPANQQTTPPQEAKPVAQAQVPEIVGKGVYDDLATLLDAFGKLSAQKFNVCFPVLKPDIIPPLHGLAIRQVSLDTRLVSGKPVGGDFYHDKGQYRLTKVGLGKLARALGVSWHPLYTRRIDDGAEPRYCHFQACGVFRQLDGTDGMVVASREMDLRDGADHGIDIEKNPGELGQARKFILSHCESRAKNRVIREIAGIRGGYSLEEMSKPFVVTALVFTGRTDDPDLRREVVREMAKRAVGSSAALFGPTASPMMLDAPIAPTVSAPPLGSVVDHDEDEAPPSDHEPQSDVPDDGRRVTKIAEVRLQEGTREGGSKWVAYHVVTEDGEQATTFSKTLGNLAMDAREAESVVAIQLKFEEKGPVLMSIAPLPK
jgi:hypothetical protein